MTKLLIPQGYFLMKYDDLRLLDEHISSKNYGRAEELITDLIRRM